MAGKFLFDATYLSSRNDGRGVAQVVADCVEAILSEGSRERRADFLVEKKHAEYFAGRYGLQPEALVTIADNPLPFNRYHGFGSDWRYRFDARRYRFVFVPEYRSLRFRSPVPQVVLVYDRIFPRWWKSEWAQAGWKRGTDLVAYLAWKHFKLRCAQRFVCISNSTRKDLECNLPAARAHSRVLHLGVRSLPPPFPPIGLEPQRGPFLLYVGGFDARKNVTSLIRAFAGVALDCDLVLAGKAGPSRRRELDSAASKSGNRIRFTGPVSEAELSWLYSRASALVFPSLYEGFGLPLVEAMSAGLPVSAFDNSSIPEVVGDAALLAPRGDMALLLRHAGRILEDGDLRARLSKRGRERAAMFSRTRFRTAFRKLLKGYFREFVGEVDA